MSTTFKQGEDKKITITVISKGTDVDVSTCTNIKAIIRMDNEPQKKYSLLEESDHGILLVDEDTVNKVHIFIEREHSKNFPIGQMNLVLLCSFPNSDFADGTEVREFAFNSGRVIKGNGADEFI